MYPVIRLAAAAVPLFSVFAFADVTATVNGSLNVKPISPLIYGSNQNTIPGTNDRLGGNRWTAYNWETNASNAGRDYQYQNDGFLSSSSTPGAAILPTLQAAAAAGRATTLTVPIVGYVSADKNGGGDVRNSGANYLSTRFNISSPVKGSALSTSPNLSDGHVYQDEFVNWVNANKTAGQQVLYDLDNEPDLWSDTHPEVHPTAATYAELIQRNTDYAKAIKSVSPNAKVLGAVNYGWGGYRNLQGAPDANARDFQATYLAAMKTAGDAAGKRLIDSLDFHYYPEAQSGTTGSGSRITGSATDAASVAARVQAPRSLWDPTYIENSYITRDILQGADKPIRLLPRTQQIIDTNYAGTGMSVSEYNFGGGNHISGGIAQADTLGVFAEQGVFSANWWDLGSGSTFTSAAQRIYLNYDGQGGHFGDTSLGSTVSDNGLASVHASRDSVTGKLVLVVINKSDVAQNLALSLQNIKAYTTGQAYGFGGASVASGGVVPIASLGGVGISNGALNFAMTPMSVTTLAFKPALAGDADLDGGVSINDFNVLAANFGLATGRTWLQGDFDGDGGVSINDFNLLAANFGRTLPASGDTWAGLLAFAAAHHDLAAFEATTGVPEPGVIAGLAVAGGLLRRRSP